jgi:hypothetical protein
MKARLALLCLVVISALVSCRPDTVDLSYGYLPQGAVTYRMHAHASATWDIGGEGSGTYDVTFSVTETVESQDEGGVVVSVLMVPERVEERGLPSPGTDERSFALRIDPNGEVLEVLEVDGVAAEALDPDELAFIGTYRPPLPRDPVRLGDAWQAQQEVDLPAVSQQIAVLGELSGLRRDAQGKLAELVYSGEGPLVWATTLPQGEAELSGSAVTATEAELDIDEGFLRTATSSTSGDFDVRVDPGGQQAPIVGTLQLDLDLSLEKLTP